MSLKEKIAQDFTQAFKEKDLEKKEALSMIQSEIKNKEIELGKKEDGLNDEEIAGVLGRAIKQRKDSVRQYSKGGRKDLADKEQNEIDILQEYLPAQMNDEEIEIEVRKVIEQTKSRGKCNLGEVMGLSMGKMKGKAEGTKVREVATKLLEEE